MKNRNFFSKNELEALDVAGFPQPLKGEDLSDLISKIHRDLKEESVVCTVCDEICLLTKTKLLDINSLPAAFFTELRTPTGVDGEAPLLPDELVKQYDVSEYFPGDERFKNLLLSPRGLKTPDCDCQLKQNSCCVYRFYICDKPGCFQSLRRGTIPKFAIAQGNWIGLLPKELQNMTYGSRCLIRPMQSFGRMAAFYNGRGMRLTGHVYSNKLSTPLVRKKLPIKPEDVPVRVLVVSPLATDASATARARMASIKKEYVIEPEKINATLQFFKKVGKKVMESIEYDEHELRELPNCDVSVEMFHVDGTTTLCDKEKNMTNEGNEKQNEDSNVHADDSISDDNGTVDELKESSVTGEMILQRKCSSNETGGPCLLKSNTDAEEAVLISSTVTVGATEVCEDNVHEKVVRALNDGVVENNKGIVVLFSYVN